MSFRKPWITLLLAFLSAPGSPGDPGIRPAHAQDATRTEAAEVRGPTPGPTAEEKTILGLDEAFVQAYNNGDAKALAALFAEDAEVVEDDGSHYRGRALVAKSLAETFEANKGAKIAFDVESIRFLTPDAAKEEGRSIVTPVKGPAVSRLYTVLYVRREGRWLIADVREEHDPSVPPHERLEELSWLIGDWLDEGDDAVVRVNCRWSEDGNFLIRSFTVKHQGKPALSIIQRIGWDPLAKQLRSWEFDSEGGFGEGRWTRDGDRWIVKHAAVQPEGSAASATNIMTRERPDLVRWVSTDRIVDGRRESDGATYTLVRVPSSPGPKADDKKATSESPDAPRSPR
ncbi:MAG: SgcJ/EcaC family oxidoreductase [Paludisphaera borealis]|uniref:YybH family protein n=1 Tax=Paludisphaera borealis TaxID=1387353 RepID=UPI0028522742|nr:SgcJ/EcaC family oxidoreductase [Paludisphaera borealis]MDR3621909.1 SgcJ/EcaC family oxidoreductase [Paludisphaera borealis]